MLHNLNLMNSSNHRIFKSIGFVPSHCVSVLSKFDYMFKSVV